MKVNFIDNKKKFVNDFVIILSILILFLVVLGFHYFYNYNHLLELKHQQKVINDQLEKINLEKKKYLDLKNKMKKLNNNYNNLEK